jgi:MerR family transcriptional regulator, copper efflux regulator
MLISELSKHAGISIHTIRFYEKSGLIKGKKSESVKTNNYKHYEDEAIEKLSLIRDAKSVGFTLNEIGQLIEAWYNSKFTTRKKLAILDEKLVSLDTKIKELKEMKKLIATFKNEVVRKSC